MEGVKVLGYREIIHRHEKEVEEKMFQTHKTGYIRKLL